MVVRRRRLTTIHAACGFMLYKRRSAPLIHLRTVVQCGDICTPILMYADDIVLLGEYLRTLVNTLNDWCSKWGAAINLIQLKQKSCIVDQMLSLDRNGDSPVVVESWNI